VIDPINPGPAGSAGPAGTTAGVQPPGDLTGTLAAGSAIIAQAISTFSAAIQSQIDRIFSVVNDAAVKLATSVAGQYNAAETIGVTTAASGQAAINAQAAAVTVAGGGGGPADQGIKEGTYEWNVYQYINAPYPARAAPAIGLAGEDMQLWCYRGSWQNSLDAVRYTLLIGGSAPPAGCQLPGGPATPPTTPTQQPACDTGYQVWQLLGPPGTPNQCAVTCGGGSAMPPPWVPYGTVGDLATAQAAMALICGGGTVTGMGPPTVPTPTVCASGAAPICPETCPTTPPVTGPPTVQTGQCCGVNPTTGAMILPTCIFVDLCSTANMITAIREGLYQGLCKWTADDGCFYEPVWHAIKKALCEFILDPECNCPTRDSDRWITEDCDGQFNQMMQGWLGKIGGAVVGAGNVDRLVEAAVSNSSYYPGVLGDGIDPP